MSSVLVLPGEFICKEEEYLAHKNVYIDEKGNVRAAVIGKVVLDNVNRRISVKPFKEIKMPKIGEVVIGYVRSMRDDVAHVEVLGYDIAKPFKHSFTAILHISQVTNTKGENLYNYVRLGDVIKARVLNDYLPLLITIKEPKLGVILAYCSRCGGQLHRDDDKLICPICGNIESRKISLDYMLTRGRRGAKT